MTFIKSSRESEWVSHKPTSRCYRIQSKLVAINYRLARRKDSSRRRRWKLSIPRPSIESLILTSAASNTISHKKLSVSGEGWWWGGANFFYDTIDNSSIHKPRRVCSVVPSYQLFFIILIYLLVQNKTDDDSHFSLTLHQQPSRAALSLKRYFCWYFSNTKSSLRQTIVTIFLYSTRRYFDPENVTHVLVNCCVRSERGATVESTGILLTDWLNVEAYQFAPHWRI